MLLKVCKENCIKKFVYNNLCKESCVNQLCKESWVNKVVWKQLREESFVNKVRYRDNNNKQITPHSTRFRCVPNIASEEVVQAA